MNMSEFVEELHKARPADVWYCDFFPNGFKLSVGWVSGGAGTGIHLTCWEAYRVPDDAVSCAVKAFDEWQWHARKAAA